MWTNPNPIAVKITRVYMPGGAQITAVGNPARTASARRLQRGRDDRGLVLASNNGDQTVVSLPLWVTSSFPLADARLRLAVVAESAPVVRTALLVQAVWVAISLPWAILVGKVIRAGHGRWQRCWNGWGPELPVPFRSREGT